MKTYKFIRFHQYESDKPSDELIMFAARAKDLSAWAGIPRKGWKIRMLFQRPITVARDQELKAFWDHASQSSEQGGFILGPTAVIVAIQGEPKITADNLIDLSYTCPIDLLGEPPEQVVAKLAQRLFQMVTPRLSPEQIELLNDRNGKEFTDLPDIDSDYVFEFALQLQQMKTDPTLFIEKNKIDGEGVLEIIKSMEAVLRPAIVVDGQHRLHGASSSKREIILPVVAIPACNWTEQIYQFVVINEKAQKVDTSLLSDIFGSSLTAKEQEGIREKLARSKVEIDARIASVIANRDLKSPFKDMVIVKMEGTTPQNLSPYITDGTIRALIDGSTRKHSRGWRTDEEFFECYIAPTLSDRADWDSWSGGKWMEYWFAFWSEVRNFYNIPEKKRRSDNEKIDQLWSTTIQSNLTKGVTLRQIQSLFIGFCIDNISKIKDTREMLMSMNDDQEQVDQQIERKLKENALPLDLDEFKKFVREQFLQRGIDAKVFKKKWVSSLDDAQGQEYLWELLSTAFNKGRKGETFVLKNKDIFAVDQEK